MDTLFFPVNNQLLPGSEAAVILYSAYVFMMLIVMSNIMVSLLNAYLFSFHRIKLDLFRVVLQLLM